MPHRPMSREQMWILPPSLEELLPADHPARFVGEFVDALEEEKWAELGVEIEGGRLGAPAYHPRGLLSVWLYGFMTGVRSSRKLEMACGEQIPYLWLTGCQRPDHVTLWRFYKAHRQGMRKLFERTVRMAVRMKLVSLAVQAVDGTKVGANAARDRTYDAEGLGRLLKRLEETIRELEAQNEGGEDAEPVRLPKKLAEKNGLRERVREAMEELADQQDTKRINLTDAEAHFMKTRQGIMPAYNAQAVVSPVELEGNNKSMLVTAVEVVEETNDYARLIPMLEQAEDTTDTKAETTLADAGYHSGSNLEECDNRDQQVVMPEAQHKALKHPYHKDRFSYDQDSDSYICPQGQRLRFSTMKTTRGVPMRLYRGSAALCRRCPAFGVCTKDRRHGRALEIGPHEVVLRSHRVWMSTEEAKKKYKRRQHLVEPVFGIIKEQQAGRRFLLRGRAKVAAEWTMLATAFNLRTLWRAWRSRTRPQGAGDCVNSEFSTYRSVLTRIIGSALEILALLRTDLQPPSHGGLAFRPPQSNI